jgi:transposase-like protein
MKSPKILVLDDFRPRITERMHCLFCGVTHVLRHLVHRRESYFECPGCDETASVPEWSLLVR